MIKNKIIFALLLVSINCCFTTPSFSMEDNKSVTKPENKKKKSTLNKVLKKRLILKALMDDKEDSSNSIEELGLFITSIILSGATTAVLNHQEIIPITKFLIERYKNKKKDDYFWNSSFKRDYSSDLIKIGAEFTLFSLVYYVSLNFLVMVTSKNKDSDDTEKTLLLINALQELNE